MFLGKRILKICSKLLEKTHAEGDFNKEYSPVSLLHIFRTPFPTNTCGELLLVFYNNVSRKSFKEIPRRACCLQKIDFRRGCFCWIYPKIIQLPMSQKTSTYLLLLYVCKRACMFPENRFPLWIFLLNLFKNCRNSYVPKNV